MNDSYHSYCNSAEDDRIVCRIMFIVLWKKICCMQKSAHNH